MSTVENPFVLSYQQIWVVDNIDTGKRMAFMRKEAGISLRQFAKLCGVSAPYLSDLERGRRNWSEKLITMYKKQLRSM